MFPRLVKQFSRVAHLSKAGSGDPESRRLSSVNGDYTYEHPRPFVPTVDDEACSKLWKVYINQAEEYNESLLREWKADMEALLIFSALYSASLTAFIIESYKTLQDDPVQNTVILLSQIAQQLSGRTVSPIPPLPSFEPPVTALVCNTFWFISLALALACSLLATFVQQWTRDFIHKTTLKPSPIRKARIIAYLYFGLQDFGMQTLVDVIPLLLHVSLFLFFAGMVSFLAPVNKPLAYIMTVVVGIFFTIYIVLTFLPLLYLDSPYRTPLSRVIWRLGNVLSSLLARRILQEETLTDAMLEKSVQDTAERRERDKQAILRTIKSLTDDNELLPFIEAIPEALYDPSQEIKIRETNAALLIPLLLSSEPGVNIISRIAQFASRSSSLAGDFRTRGSSACSQALSTIAWIYLDLPSSRLRRSYIPFHRQWNMLSSLKFVGPSSLVNEVWSTLISIGISCLYCVIEGSLAKNAPPSLDGTTAADTCRSLFKEVSVHAGGLLPISQAPSSQAIVRKIFEKVSKGRHTMTEIDAFISQFRGGEIWQFIRVHVLHDYLILSQRRAILPADFENICDAIYPDSEVSMEMDVDDPKLISFFHASNSLLPFKDGIKHEKFNEFTDALMRQHLKLFLSTSKPLCAPEVARECRQFVLGYIYRRYEDDRIANTLFWEPLEGFKMHDLQRVGFCILEHVQDTDVVELSLRLEVAFILLCTHTLEFRQLRNQGDFYPRLSSSLRDMPQNARLKQVEGYPFFKVFLDLALCNRLTTSSQSPPAEALHQSNLGVDYLQDLHSLEPMDSRLYRDTSKVAIVSRYIDLSCEHEIPSHCKSVLTAVFSPNDVTTVHDAIQVVFAESVSKLIKIITSKGTEPDMRSLILYDVFSSFGDHSWRWITSRHSATILSDAISQYEGPENIQMADGDKWLRKRGEKGRERLLAQCQRLKVN